MPGAGLLRVARPKAVGVLMNPELPDFGASDGLNSLLRMNEPNLDAYC